MIHSATLDIPSSESSNSFLSGNQVPLNSKWLTALSDKALRIGAEARLESLGKRLPNIKVKDLTLPQRETATYVGWDQGKIAKVGAPSLYSTQFGPCLAILARAFTKDSQEVAYTSLNHIFMRPETLSPTLQELVSKINQAGRIEFFISGGHQSSQLKLDQIRKIIEISRTMFPSVQFEEADHTFGIAELGECYFEVKSKEIILRGSCGLSYAGFDQFYNPYQVLDFSHTPEETPLEGIESIFWAI